MEKRCPLCFRTYSDFSLNFCLADGSILSNSIDLLTKLGEGEVETIVKSRIEHNTDESTKDNWVGDWPPQKTIRTSSEHPISSSPKTTDRPFVEWTASDFLREITYLITGYHTYHAQECLELLRRFLNGYIRNERQKLRRTTWQNGRGHFHSDGGVLTYDFQRGAEPSARDLLLNLLAFATAGTSSGPVRPRQPVLLDESRRSDSGLEYIRAAVATHANLELLVHPGNNHRILKEGHVGSVWIVPRKDGVSITANGQAADRLYKEMERLLGAHHRIDQKGYKYFQANDPVDVAKIIGVWSDL